MKTTTLGIASGTAIAALGHAITAVPEAKAGGVYWNNNGCLLYTSPSPRDYAASRMPSSA